MFLIQLEWKDNISQMNNQYEIRNTQVTSGQNGALALDINLLQISEQLIDLLILVIIGLAVQIAWQII